VALATIRSDHGPTIGVDDLGDGDTRITLWSNLTNDGPQVSVTLTGEEVERLRDLLDRALEDY
jgi:hypothetical protein